MLKQKAMTIFKTATKKNQGYFLGLILALISITLLASCNKNDDDELVEPSFSNLKIVHSLPSHSTLDFYWDGELLTRQALSYGQSAGYGGVFTGNHQIDVVPGGTLTSISRKVYNLEEDAFYTLFVSKVSATNDSVTTVFTKDDLSAPPTGKAKVRFVHLSQNAPNLDLAIQGGATLFPDKIFNSFTEFTAIDPGAYVFQLKDAGTANVRASSAQAVTISAGKIYTIWAEGLVNGVDPVDLDVQVMEN